VAVLVIRARKLPKVKPIHVILLLLILACNVREVVSTVLSHADGLSVQFVGIFCDLPTCVHVSPHDLAYIDVPWLREYFFGKGDILYIPYV
jgi:hypothetical protein